MLFTINTKSKARQENGRDQKKADITSKKQPKSINPTPKVNQNKQATYYQPIPFLRFKGKSRGKREKASVQRKAIITYKKQPKNRNDFWNKPKQATYILSTNLFFVTVETKAREKQENARDQRKSAITSKKQPEIHNSS